MEMMAMAICPLLQRSFIKLILYIRVCQLLCHEEYILYIQNIFEDIKGVIRSRKSKSRQYNDQKKNDKRANNDLQNTHNNI